MQSLFSVCNFCFLYFCIAQLFAVYSGPCVSVFFSERKAPLFIAMDDHQVSFMCSDFRFSASNIFLFFSFCSSRCSCLVFFPCSTCFCFFLFLVPGFVFFLFARKVPLSFFICQISPWAFFGLGPSCFFSFLCLFSFFVGPKSIFYIFCANNKKQQQQQQ